MDVVSCDNPPVNCRGSGLANTQLRKENKMNLFGIEIKFNNKGKIRYVDKSSCEQTVENIHHRISTLETHITNRFDDFKDFLLKYKKGE